MPYNNGITRAPVGIADAQKAFYNNSDDLATIILNGIYNPNSKYKPVRLYGNDLPLQLTVPDGYLQKFDLQA